MLILLNLLWFFRTSKYVLFWLYLWQLKEYHVGRLVDHFRTEKGKQLFLSPIIGGKIVLLILLTAGGSLLNFWLIILYLVYLGETALFVKQIFTNSVKKPVITFKTLFLITISFVATIGFMIFATDLPGWLLLFDILTPLAVTAIVLIFQPIFVSLRNNVLRKATAKLAEVRQKKELKVIAITGSYGKTSTKEFLTTILSKRFKVLATKEHQNSEIGVANCILNELSPEHEIFVAEVGAYNKGKVKEVCSVIKPNIGIVTGVNEQHLSLFGSLDNLLAGEGGRELAAFLEKDGLLVVNGDNKYCLDLIKRFNGAEKIYSKDNKLLNADIWSESIIVNKNTISFIAKNKKGELADFSTNAIGEQNVQNLLGAILVARELGMSFGEISEACRSIKQAQSGVLLKQGKHGIFIIDSSYSANPDGVIADLNYLNIYKNKKVVVMPCLIELGPKSKEIHEKIGKKIGRVCNLAIITSKECFEDIKRGAKSAGMADKNILLCDKAEDIVSAITVFCKSGDAVLLEGRVPAKVINLLVN